MKGVAICLAAGVAVTLQGCGGGSTTTQKPGPTPPPTTTPAPGPAPEPTPSGPDGQFTGPEAETYLNDLYMGFDPDDDTSPLGVTVNMQSGSDFHFFCGGSCYEGHADCRISTSVVNKHVQISQSDNYVQTMDRPVGLVFNQSAVESQFTKCSYVYDGASFTKLNLGCGCAALGTGCGNVMSAYSNFDCAYSDNFDANACTNACQASNSTLPCMQADPTTEDVEPCYCKSDHLSQKFPNYDVDASNVPQCYYKGPAFYPGTTTASETREMLTRRMTSQVTNHSYDTERYKPEYWNEVVLDANVVLEALQAKAAAVVVAIVYAPTFKQLAQALADNMKTQYNMSMPVPVILFDTTVNVTTTPPYVYEATAVESVTV